MEFQVNQNYTVRFCLWKKKKNLTAFKRKPEDHFIKMQEKNDKTAKLKRWVAFRERRWERRENCSF